MEYITTMEKSELESFVTDMNSLEPRPSQPLASTPRKRSGTPRKRGVVTPLLDSGSSSNKRKYSGSSNRQNSTTVTPGKSTSNSRNEDRTNINSQDLRDGMKALEKGFQTFKVVTEEGELRDMLNIIVKCYKSGYCADHPGNNMEGKHVITL